MHCSTTTMQQKASMIFISAELPQLCLANRAVVCCLAGEGLLVDELNFETRSGTLTVKHTEDGLFHLSVPSLPPIDLNPGTPDEMGEIMEARPSSAQFCRSQRDLFRWQNRTDTMHVRHPACMMHAWHPNDTAQCAHPDTWTRSRQVQ